MWTFGIIWLCMVIRDKDDQLIIIELKNVVRKKGKPNSLSIYKSGDCRAYSHSDAYLPLDAFSFSLSISYHILFFLHKSMIDHNFSNNCRSRLRRDHALLWRSGSGQLLLYWVFVSFIDDRDSIYTIYRLSGGK